MENTEEKKMQMDVVNKTNIVSWLQQNIMVNPEKDLTLDEISTEINKNSSMDKHAIGRAVKKIFPGINSKRRRNKSDWTSICVVCQGISWRKTDSEQAKTTFQFGSIPQLSADFFVIKNTDCSITLGHISNFTINHNRVIIEVVFKNDSAYFFKFCAIQNIQPDTFGMNNNYVLERNNILGILDAVRNFKICHGIPNIDLNENKDNVLKEIFTILHDENSTKSVYRSIKCSRILNFRNHNSSKICSACKGLLKSKENGQDDNAFVRKPFQDISNTCDNGNKATILPSKVFSEHTYVIKDNLCANKSKKILEKEGHIDHGYSRIKIPQNSKLKGKTETQNLTLNLPVSESPGPSNDTIELSDSDRNDLDKIINEIGKECPPKILEFLVAQKQADSSLLNGRRWNPNVIRLCLTLWCRSPKCYSDLRDSGFVLLPSQKTLQIYKNKFQQTAGFNKELIHWMKHEALLRNVCSQGYEGGLILDEMSIQSDLQFHSKNGKSYLIGFTEVLDESKLMNSIHTGKREVKLATHVLQFVFLGFTGFRFPLFHFPTTAATAAELCLLFWKIVNLLMAFGFIIRYVSLDGAQTNRDLGKILLGDFKSSTVKTMKVKNIFSMSSQNIYVIMDYSHVMKKIRNNISKSGKQDTYKKHLFHKGHYIYWEHLKNAYLWDISNNPFPVHHKLTHEHFHLSSESKMRNALAEDVLNTEMLHLMKLYAESFGEKKR